MNTKASSKNIKAESWYLVCRGLVIARGPFAKQYDAKVAAYQTTWPASSNNHILFTAVRGAKLIEQGMPFAPYYKELTPLQTVNATKRAALEKDKLKAVRATAKHLSNKLYNQMCAAI